MCFAHSAERFVVITIAKIVKLYSGRFKTPLAF